MQQLCVLIVDPSQISGKDFERAFINNHDKDFQRFFRGMPWVRLTRHCWGMYPPIMLVSPEKVPKRIFELFTKQLEKLGENMAKYVLVNVETNEPDVSTERFMSWTSAQEANVAINMAQEANPSDPATKKRWRLLESCGSYGPGEKVVVKTPPPPVKPDGAMVSGAVGTADLTQKNVIKDPDPETTKQEVEAGKSEIKSQISEIVKGADQAKKDGK